MTVDIFLLFAGFILLLIIGTSVASAMIISACAVLWLEGMPPIIAAERALSAINSYTLLAVPFFVFAAIIMNRGGLTERLFDVARCFVGHYRGGSAQVDVLASIFFAGMSGSATADAASQGRIMIPHMHKEGYSLGFAAGVNSASATIGAIIPPSITMVVYGAITNLSVGALFLAGILPGLAIGIGLMFAVWVFSVRRNYPRRDYVPWSKRWRPIAIALPALFAPVIILGGIFTGVTTPTEAGVIACAYGLFLAIIIYREIEMRDIFPLLVETVVATAVPVFIIAAGSIFGFALTTSGFGFLVQDSLSGITESPVVFMMIIVAIFMTVGLFVDGTTAKLIFVPLFAPLASQYDIPPLQFAIVVIITILVGTITPPVGLQLFVSANIARISVFKVDVWPFVAIMMSVVMLLILFPSITTILPTLLL